MGHGRVVVAVVGVLLAFPAVAWGDGTLNVSMGNATYTDSTLPAGAVDNLDIVVGTNPRRPRARLSVCPARR